MFIKEMAAQKYIESTRAYLNYVEEHINNVAKAFHELSEACNGKEHWVGDDFTWHTIKRDAELHDLSKLSRLELCQYRDNFYPVTEMDKINSDFKSAWEHHKESNPHHHETAKNYHDYVHLVIDLMAMSYKFGGCPFKYFKDNKGKINLPLDAIDFIELQFGHLLAYRKKNGK